MGDPAGIFPGVSLAVMLATIILSVPIARILLWAYRRAMRAAMLRQAAAGAGVESAQPLLQLHRFPRHQLLIEVRGRYVERDLQPEAMRILRRALWKPWATILVYCVAGLGHAVVVTAIWLLILGDQLYATRTTVLLWSFAWPLVLTVNLIVDANRRTQIRNALLYLACLPVFVLLAWLSSYSVRAITGRDLLPASMGFSIFWDVLIYALIFMTLIAAPPLLLILFALMHRSLRAIGLMAVSMMFVGIVGVFSAFALIFFTPDIDSAPGTRVVAVFSVFVRDVLPFPLDSAVRIPIILFGIALVAFTLAGLLGWRVLCWLSTQYAHKRISDQSLQLDAIWLMVALLAAVHTTPAGRGWAIAMLAAFVVYKTLAVAGTAVVDGLGGRQLANHRLLLLRVFGSQRRSEELMALVGARWRYAGSIQLIAGIDLATANVEPHEFLDFVRGKLADHYVRDEADLERHLAEMDLRPDPGGRFRVNEFFCYDDTWRMTLSRLTQCSDAVLMDLRGFTRANQGVIYELHELVNVVPLSKVVLITDATTDHECLRDSLGSAWNAMAADSPNRAPHCNRIVVCHLKRGDLSGAKLVLSSLTRAVALERVPHPGDLATAEPGATGDLIVSSLASGAQMRLETPDQAF